MSRLFFISIIALSFLGVKTAEANYWEVTTGLSYNRSNYSGGSYSWTRRLGGSIGYNISDISTVEVAYQNSYDRNHYEGFEDSEYADQVYSANFVWNIMGRSSSIQPYLKVGVGQLNRKATITDSLGRSQVQDLNQVTGVLGGGLKFYVTKTFAIRLEGTSYLSGAKISTWQDNFGATFGVSFYY